MKVDIPTTLFPETQEAFRQVAGQTAVAASCLHQVLEALGVPATTATGALYSVLVAAVQQSPPSSAGEFADKARIIRGFGVALVAYANAPDHQAGCAAMNAVARATNEQQFQALDAVVAQHMKPRA